MSAHQIATFIIAALRKTPLQNRLLCHCKYLLFVPLVCGLSGCLDNNTSNPPVEQSDTPALVDAQAPTPVSAQLTAWVGENDTLVDIQIPDDELAVFYRSREEDCDFDNYTSCDFGQLDIPNGEFIRDTALTLSQQAYYAFENEQGLSSVRLMNGAKDHTRGKVLSFRGKLWRIAPRAAYPQYDFKVWSSNDGYNWQAEPHNAEMLRRVDHDIVVFQNKLWLIAGFQTSTFPAGPANDVWSSEDGISWQLERSSANFPPMYRHKAVVFNDRIWLIGGSTAEGPTEQVWNSANGVDWVAYDVSEGLLPIRGHDITVHNDELWLVGGWDGSRHRNDAWSSKDGVNWQPITRNAAFRSRQQHQLLSYKSSLWITGGRTGTGRIDDVWTSTDGKEWRQVSASGAFAPVTDHSFLVFNDQMMLMDGGSNRTDTWFSSDGESWHKPITNPTSRNAAAVQHGGKLWVFGRHSGLWSSDKGLEWTKTGSIESFYKDTTSQLRQYLLSFQGRLWLILDYSNDELDSVWSTSNGSDWREEQSPEPQLNVLSYKAIVVRDEIWLLVNSAFHGRLVYTFDGIQWGQINVADYPTPVRSPAFVEFKDKLWRIGGWEKIVRTFTDKYFCGKVVFLGGPTCASERSVKEVWSTENGSDWVLETDSANFDTVTGAYAVVKDQKLWVFSGSKYWSSADGIEWDYEGEISTFTRSQNAPVNVIDNEFWTVELDIQRGHHAWREIEGTWRKGFSATLIPE